MGKNNSLLVFFCAMFIFGIFFYCVWLENKIVSLESKISEIPKEECWEKEYASIHKDDDACNALFENEKGTMICIKRVKHCKLILSSGEEIMAR